MSDPRFKAAITSLMVPCVTGHYKEWLLLLSEASTIASLLTSLLIIPAISRFDYDDIFLNPPIFYCFSTANETLSGNVCTLNSDGEVAECGYSHMRLCLDNDCLDSVRYCASNEGPWDLLNTKIVPILIVFLCDCLALGAILQWMSNYLHVYKYSMRPSFWPTDNSSLICTHRWRIFKNKFTLKIHIKQLAFHIFKPIALK